MIFIYPALCSQNVDPRIVPAITRALEKYYLMNLCEAFSSGSLRPKSKWDHSKQVYGTVVLEAADKGESITRPVYILQSELYDIIDPLLDEVNSVSAKYSSFQVSDYSNSSYVELHQQQIDAFVRDVHRRLDTARRILTKLLNESNDRQEWPDAVTYDISILKHISSESESRFEKVEKSCQNPLNNLERQSKVLKRLSDSLKSKEKDIKDSDKKNFDQIKFDEDKKQREKEEQRKKEEEQSQLAKPHAGGWQLQEYSGIGFEPTVARVDVKIQYLGGPYDEIDNKDSRIEMNVGVKIVPYKVVASNIINALYDDYFSFGYQQLFKKYWRRTARVAIKYIEKFIYKVTGKNVDLLAKAAPVDRELLYAPAHGVDASSFKRKTNTPFYQYSAALVVLNRDEIKDIDNILTDPGQLKKLLKMGWNSICVLDDINEHVYFITTIDGGYIHQLPYAYIFSSLKMDKTYENIDDLQKQTRQFESTSGTGFSAFGNKILKENLLLASMRHRITHEGN